MSNLSLKNLFCR